MTENIHELRRLVVGRAVLTVSAVYDDCPMFDHIGKFTETPDSKFAYHRPSGLMWVDQTVWRDAHGNYAASPLDDYPRYRNEYTWITPCTWDGEGFREAYRAARRLDRIDDDWGFVGICADVRYDGREIGNGSLWGIEVDWNVNWDTDPYIHETAREVTREAINDAQEWRRAVTKG